MDKTYNPSTIEYDWNQRWEKIEAFSPTGQGSPYCIMLPPPNVTGSLHMGHGFQHTLMDALIRYHRMRGFNTLWQGGVDHAGIATQIVVERQLEKENKTRHDLGREVFMERVWQWKAESGGTITRQMQRMGSSIDWSRTCFTMDDNFSDAVQHAFIKLYRDGLIYKGKKLVNWDPKLQSAVSDLEVVVKEEAGHLWHIRYPLVEDPTTYIVVATTRPETLFGDAAVAVNPADERYQGLIGKQVKLPLTNHSIPIIADDYVEANFGTGCVKITPAHDFNDYAVGQRHGLPMKNILTPQAQLNETVPIAYQGLGRLEARRKVVEDIKNAQLLEKVDPYLSNIPRCERTGEVIEPFLTDQWYITMQPLAEKAIKVVEEGELSFIPENWTKTYLQWLNNIQDWCISRQLWWGHRIPVWYDDQNNAYVGQNEEEVRKQYALGADMVLRQEEDVLDTWFSSALWPFATLGWPQETPELATFFPTHTLVTGFDIIFFWVARMVMFSLYFTGKVPFKTVYITGLIRDHQGQKMSKSKGNILDPIDLIDGITLENLLQKRTYGLLNPKMAEQITQQTRQQFPEGIPAFGTDALRYTFCALANTGRDIRFDLGRIGGYRNFCNKLWNAARYVLTNTETYHYDSGCVYELHEIDQWVQARLQQTIAEVHQHFEHYRFDLLAQSLYEFFWHDYCDWYLELAKVKLMHPSMTEAQKASTQYMLLMVLETVLRLLHPLMPYITEEIWQRLAPRLDLSGSTLQRQVYPEKQEVTQDLLTKESIQWLQAVVMAIRNIRSEMQVSPAKKITVLLQNGTDQDHRFSVMWGPWLESLAKLSSFSWLSADKTPPQSATAVLGEMQLFIPLENLIDVKAETARLTKEIQKIQLELDKAQQKLANPNYLQKARPEVVNQEKERALDWQRKLEKLQMQLQALH